MSVQCAMSNDPIVVISGLIILLSPKSSLYLFHIFQPAMTAWLPKGQIDRGSPVDKIKIQTTCTVLPCHLNKIYLLTYSLCIIDHRGWYIIHINCWLDLSMVICNLPLSHYHIHKPWQMNRPSGFVTLLRPTAMRRSRSYVIYYHTWVWGFLTGSF